MPVRSSTPGWGNAPCGCGARQSAGFREETAIPKQFRAGMVLLTAFLIPPIRREGVMRTKLAIVAVLLRVTSGRPLAPTRPRHRLCPTRRSIFSSPHSPGPCHARRSGGRIRRSRLWPSRRCRGRSTITAASGARRNRNSSRSGRSKPRPRPPWPKPRPRARRRIVLRRSRTSAAKDQKAVKDQKVVKDQKAGTSDATSAVQPPAQAKPPRPEHRLRQPAPAILTTQEEPAVAAAPPPEPEPDAAPEQQQTATASPTPPADDQDERTRWWAQEGSPAVVRFRDCIAAYAVRNIGKDSRTTWADLLIRAAESDCRQSFNDMAHTLSARLGSEAAEPVIRSLIETTLLPAARKAVSSTQRVAGGKSDPQPNAPAPIR